jgi:hypothetical protein
MVEFLAGVGAAFVSLFGFGAPTTAAVPPDSQPASAIIAFSEASELVDAATTSATTTIVNQYITQPVIEREVLASNAVTREELDASLAALRADLLTIIANNLPKAYNFSGPADTTPVSTTAFSYSQKIDQLSGTSLSNITVSGVTGLTDSDIPDSITASNYLPLSGGSLTFASSTLFSVFNGAYFGATATSTFTSSGWLGIGTTSPAVALDVVGGANIARFSRSGLSQGTLELNDGNGDPKLILYSGLFTGNTWSVAHDTSANALVLGTSAVDPATGAKLTISSAGNVGIGTTSPTKKLDVAGTAGITNLASNIVTDYYAFGDSITQGSAASSASKRYANIIATALSYTLHNQGVGGADMQSRGMIDKIYAYRVGTTTIASLLTGYNNVRHFSWPNTQGIADYKDALGAALVYTSVPDSNKVYANNPGYSSYTFTFTGTWTATSTYTTYSGGNFGKYTTTAGDTASVTIKGTSLYIVGTKTNNSSGSFSLTIDGKDYGDYSCGNFSNTDGADGPVTTYGPLFMRVSNLAPGTHSVVITNNTNAYCELDWAASNNGLWTDAAPAIYVSGPLTTTAVGYAGATVGSANGPTAHAAYTAATDQVVKQLISDGLNVVAVDAMHAYDPDTMLSGDNSHPNDYGHAILAQTFLNRMQGTSYGADKNLSRFFSGYFPLLTFGSGSTTALTIDGENKKVGIGTTTPWAALSVQNTYGGSGTALFTVASSTASDGSSAANVLTVLSTGNVGIGTTSPTVALDVVGGANIARFSRSGVTQGSLELSNANSDPKLILYGDLYSGNTWSVGLDNSANALMFGTSAVDPSTGAKLTISSGGNVGIGTTSPSSLLSLHKDSTTQFNIDFSDASSFGQIIFSQGSAVSSRINQMGPSFATANRQNYLELFNTTSSGGVSFWTQSNERMRIDSSGNVGIGTTTAWGKLSVQQTGTSGAPSFIVEDQADDTTPFVVDQSGNIGIGTSAPSAKLEITGGSGIEDRVRFITAGGASNRTLDFDRTLASSAWSLQGRLTNNSASYTNILLNPLGGNIGIGTTSPWRTLSVTGTVGLDGLTGSTGAGSLCLTANREVVYNSASDACLPSLRETKHDISSLSFDALQIVDALDPVSFVYNDSDGRVRYGFIAEDTAAVDPHLVTYSASGTLSGIDDRSIISVVVKAIQELTKTIASFANSFTTTELHYTRASGDEITTKKLCIGATCITESQLQALLANAGSASSSPAPSEEDDAIDAEAPTITINGSNPATLHVGDTYNDLGATVTDNVDVNLGIRVFVGSTPLDQVVLDTSEANEWHIHYVATDNAGNTATSTRTVHVEAPSRSDAPIEEPQSEQESEDEPTADSQPTEL